VGAHSTYNVEVADKIIEWIRSGKTLREFCRQPGTPSFGTVYNWQDEHPDFLERFARARDVGYDAIAEQAYEIADTPVEGLVTEESEQGTKIRREDMLGHRKLQVETRLKLLAKWNPKKYGDLVQHSGNVGVTLSQLIEKSKVKE
jgi:hypothetical protein